MGERVETDTARRVPTESIRFPSASISSHWDGLSIEEVLATGNPDELVKKPIRVSIVGQFLVALDPELLFIFRKMGIPQCTVLVIAGTPPSAGLYLFSQVSTAGGQTVAPESSTEDDLPIQRETYDPVSFSFFDRFVCSIPYETIRSIEDSSRHASVTTIPGIPSQFSDIQSYFASFLVPILGETRAAIADARQGHEDTSFSVFLQPAAGPDVQPGDIVTVKITFQYPNDARALLPFDILLLNLNSTRSLVVAGPVVWPPVRQAERPAPPSANLLILATPDIMPILTAAGPTNVDLTRVVNLGPTRRAALVAHHGAQLPFFKEIATGKPEDITPPEERRNLDMTLASNLRLNDSQQAAYAAVVGRCGQRGVTLIQGPPGTGKTYAVASFILGRCQEHRDTTPLLVLAPTHTAVHNILKCLFGSVRGT
ncbi:hypothetical protein PAPYR_4794 [Paratrimastix pyriformis]|uniref:DNA2/NAM7 helicase helicase domain-containing protein n=1 Tax=Paratrimastix pyriformis TaxID=342808 RepID=A0ABQ8UPK2_9EUKA|nr:hypothetical protein PAPYR_4794 [Paratrimastix pyriformis]